MYPPLGHCAKVPNLHGLTKKNHFFTKKSRFLTSKLGKNQISSVSQHIYVVVRYKLLIIFTIWGKMGKNFDNLDNPHTFRIKPATLRFLINVLDQISVLVGQFVKINKHTGPNKHTGAKLLAKKYNFL